MSTKAFQLNKLLSVFTHGSLVQRVIVLSNLALVLICVLLLSMMAGLYTSGRYRGG